MKAPVPLASRRLLESLRSEPPAPPEARMRVRSQLAAVIPAMALGLSEGVAGEGLDGSEVCALPEGRTSGIGPSGSGRTLGLEGDAHSAPEGDTDNAPAGGAEGRPAEGTTELEVPRGVAKSAGKAGSLLSSHAFPLLTFVLGGITGAALLAALSGGPKGRNEPKLLAQPTPTGVVLPPPESIPSTKVGMDPSSLPSQTAPLDEARQHIPMTMAIPAGPQGERNRTAPEKASTSGHASQLTTERRILDEARARLVQGDAGHALGYLQRHRERFPKGLLAEERDAMQIEALAAQRRFDQAHAAAVAFRKHSPNSLFLPTIESAIGPPSEGP